MSSCNPCPWTNWATHSDTSEGWYMFHVKATNAMSVMDILITNLHMHMHLFTNENKKKRNMDFHSFFLNVLPTHPDAVWPWRKLAAFFPMPSPSGVSYAGLTPSIHEGFPALDATWMLTQVLMWCKLQRWMHLDAWVTIWLATRRNDGVIRPFSQDMPCVAKQSACSFFCRDMLCGFGHTFLFGSSWGFRFTVRLTTWIPGRIRRANTLNHLGGNVVFSNACWGGVIESEKLPCHDWSFLFEPLQCEARFLHCLLTASC